MLKKALSHSKYSKPHFHHLKPSSNLFPPPILHRRAGLLHFSPSHPESLLKPSKTDILRQYDLLIQQYNTDNGQGKDFNQGQGQRYKSFEEQVMRQSLFYYCCRLEDFHTAEVVANDLLQEMLKEFEKVGDKAGGLGDRQENVHRMIKNIILFGLNYNLEMAVEIAESVSDDKADLLTTLQKMEVKVLHGTGLLLEGKYKQADQVLYSAMSSLEAYNLENKDSKPPSEYEYIAKNSLAVCRWLARRQLYHETAEFKNFDPMRPADVEANWETIPKLLIQAIVGLEGIGMRDKFKQMEDVENVTSESQKMLQKVLEDIWSGEPVQMSEIELRFHLHTPSSFVSIINLGEFMMRYENTKITNATFLYAQTTGFSSKIAYREDHCRLLGLLATIMSEKGSVDEADQAFKDALAAIGPSNCFQKAETLKYYSLFMDSLDNREEELVKKVTEAREILTKLHPWSPKLMHLYLPPISPLLDTANP